MWDGIAQAPREALFNRTRARYRYRARFLCDQQTEGDDDHEDDCKVTPHASSPFVLVVVSRSFRGGRRKEGKDEDEHDWGVG